MTGTNKRKGDVAERAVRDMVTDRYPGSFKTRAGFNDDLGDVIVEHAAGRIALQVKNVASPKWAQWYPQVADQIATCRAESNRDVVGGAIVWKYRGHADPNDWHVVTQARDFFDLLDAVYAAGVKAGRDE